MQDTWTALHHVTEDPQKGHSVPGCLPTIPQTGDTRDCKTASKDILTTFVLPDCAVASRQPGMLDHFHEPGYNQMAAMPSHTKPGTPVDAGAMQLLLSTWVCC